MLARTSLAIALALAACQGTPGAPPADAGAVDAAAGPRRLSTAGLYTDIRTFTVNPRAIEFTPFNILWSDGAQKRRWIILPPGAVIDTSDMNHWKFPVGTQFFKEFSLGGRRLETRLVEHVADSGDREQDYWLGAFAWQDDGKDAVFVAEGRDNVLGTDHDIPTADQCWKCHIGEPGHILGFQAIQLSQPDGFNLTELSAAGLLSNPPPPGTLYPPPGDAVTSAALGYLHANCGHCHNPYGSAWQDASQVLRLSIEERDPAATQIYATTLGVPTMQWMAGLVKRIAPGDPAASAIFQRMSMRGDANQMPPLATEHIDPTGISKVEAWISSLPR